MMEGGTLCYVCRDKRRKVETDAVQTKFNNRPYEDTFKDILLKAIIGGIGLEETSGNGKELQADDMGNLALNLQSDFAMETLYKKVENEDTIFICKRCESLLRDFEYHERQASSLGETIRIFITKEENKEISCTSNVTPSLGVCSGRKRLEEKRGILAAFRALRKSNPVMRRGRKRQALHISSESSGTCEITRIEKKDNVIISSPEQDSESSSGTRSSKRIQRRREEGLVIHWGDAHGETVALETETENKGIMEEAFFPEEERPKRKGRKPNSCKMVKPSQDMDKVSGLHSETSLKYQCPFCFRYYIPSLSRIHGCISYKNQLRCVLCNIFFTSYIRFEKHLEVIHLKQKELKCKEPSCNFTCISQPAIVLHEHFHRLNEHNNSGSKAETMVDDAVGAGPDHVVVTADLNTGEEGVTIMDDDLGSVCSPDTVDQVSFQLDEKSLISGQPVDITVNTLKIKSALRETLPLVTESSRVVIRCEICDMEFESKRLYCDHVKEIHFLAAKGSSDMSCKVNTAKAINCTFLNVDAREIPQDLLKTSVPKESVPLVSPKRNSSEADTFRSKFKCPLCVDFLPTQKSLEDHIKSSHVTAEKDSLNNASTSSEAKVGKQIKYSFLNMDTRETLETIVKKNFGTPQASTWMVGKARDPNR